MKSYTGQERLKTISFVLLIFSIILFSLVQFFICSNSATISTSMCAGALPAWGVFFNAGQSGRIDAILKRAQMWFLQNFITVTELLTSSSTTLFRKIKYNPFHCLSTLLPPKKYVNCSLRNCDSNHELPQCTYTNHKQSVNILSARLSGTERYSPYTSS